MLLLTFISHSIIETAFPGLVSKTQNSYICKIFIIEKLVGYCLKYRYKTGILMKIQITIT